MARPFTPKIVTASHLLDGDVISLDPNGAWTRTRSEAVLFRQEAAAQAALRRAAASPNILVGPYLADAQDGPTGPAPPHFREDYSTY